MTVLEIIQRSTEFLNKKGVESPRLQAELLLAHLLQMPRMRLYLEFDRKLDDAEVEHFRQLIKRRGGREPLQHIVGSTSFCGLEFIVGRQALIPRPETELLAEQAWQLASASTQGGSGPYEVLDFGTGTGCLAITLAVKCPAIDVCALDISPEALELAKQNAARHEVSNRVKFVLGDGLKALSKKERFHLIVANPPYIPSDVIQRLDQEVKDYDPRTALDGGPDGLGYYRDLAAGAAEVLREDGTILLEFGDGQSDRVREIFLKEKWVVEDILEDYNHRPRILNARKPGLAPEAR